MSDTITELYPQIKYPTEEDFKNLPMAESSQHYDAIRYLSYVIQELLFKGRDDIYPAVDMGVYFKKDDIQRCLIPDIMVIHGVDNHTRKSYKVFEEGGKYPDLIIEITSPSTEIKDRKTAKLIYEKIFKTSEYFIFDPEEGKLEGYRHLGDKYSAMRMNKDVRYESIQLGEKIELGVVGKEIAIFKEGERLLSYWEVTEASKQKDRIIEQQTKALEQKDKEIKALKKDKIETVLAMLKENIDIAIISKATGLPPEEIKKLKKDHNILIKV